MKVLKGIGLFFIYPVLMLFLGFWGGVRAVRFFYPGEYFTQPSKTLIGDRNAYSRERSLADDNEPQDPGPENMVPEDARKVSASEEKLSTETEYVLEETDVLRKSVVETSWKLPSKYVGMNREQFLAAMDIYESAPPLSELERGFVGLEVLSFSRERVVVQMNYRYVQPGSGYYLTVRDNEVTVCLDDGETVYINTGIMLDSLPDDLQLQIIQRRYVEDERELYDFLENYSS